MESRLLRIGAFVTLAVLTAAPLVAQRAQRLPLAPRLPKGDQVAPFFEGWLSNTDGTFTFSFGYFNLNTEQILDIPIGPDNFIEPAEFNGNQPTHFPVQPRRDRGVFSVTVPASYGDGRQRVVWTITSNGKTYAVPAKVGVSALQIDYGPKAMGSVAPLVRIPPDGPEGESIQGVRSQPRTVVVGTPLTLTVWASEISERSPDDVVNRDGVSLALTWAKHQGPVAEVVFEPRRVTIEEGTGEATITATFSEAGEYLLRVRVDNFAANDSTGGDQCCWTNGYVPVTVTPADGMPDRD